MSSLNTTHPQFPIMATQGSYVVTINSGDFANIIVGGGGGGYHSEGDYHSEGSHHRKGSHRREGDYPGEGDNHRNRKNFPSYRTMIRSLVPRLSTIISYCRRPAVLLMAFYCGFSVTYRVCRIAQDPRISMWVGSRF